MKKLLNLWYQIKWAWKLRSLWRGWFSRRVDKWKFEREQKKGNSVRVEFIYNNDPKTKRVFYCDRWPDNMPNVGRMTKHGIITQWSVESVTP